jgi:hypothetical protein
VRRRGRTLCQGDQQFPQEAVGFLLSTLQVLQVREQLGQIRWRRGAKPTAQPQHERQLL